MDLGFLHTILKTIEQGQLKEALELMSNSMDYTKNHGQEISFQLSRINNLEQDKSTIPYKTYTRTKNQINWAVRDLILLLIKANKSSFEQPLVGDKSGTNYEFFEKIIGKESFLDIYWLLEGFKKSKSVCRLIYSFSEPVGTGFLIEGGFLLTNNHVIRNIKEAKRMKAQFDYEIGPEGKERPFFIYELDPDHYFETNETLDFTKVAIKENGIKPIADWHFLTLSDHLPALNEAVPIIQHPRGEHKKIALKDNKLKRITENTLEYTTDTVGGSSGSPVFNPQWEVIGLHRSQHQFEEVNIATRASKIIDLLS